MNIFQGISIGFSVVTGVSGILLRLKTAKHKEALLVLLAAVTIALLAIFQERWTSIPLIVEFTDAIVQSTTPAGFLIVFLLAMVVATVVWTCLWLVDKKPKSEMVYWAVIPLSCFAVVIGFRTFKIIDVASDRPEFHVAIEEYGFDGSLVWLVTTIWNTGTPSAVGGYQLSATLASGGPPRLGRSWTIPEHVTRCLSGKVMDNVWGEDSLWNKTAKPMPRGGFDRILGRD